MYRAKAEIVNGLRVFAGGQWLTCIGNKNVRVGDLIWTDGRCVYGFNNISQQPLVILTQKIENKAIPIIIYTELRPNGVTIHRQFDCYTFDNSFKKTPETPTILSEHAQVDSLMTNNENGNVYVLLKPYMFDYQPAKEYSSTQEMHENSTVDAYRIFALNCDNKNNIYALCNRTHADHAFPSGTGILTEQYIDVIKNGKKIDSVKIEPQISSSSTYGFIMDENTWWVIFRPSYTNGFLLDSSKNFTIVQANLKLPLSDNYYFIANGIIGNEKNTNSIGFKNQKIYSGPVGYMTTSVVGSLNHLTYLISSTLYGFASIHSGQYADRLLFICENGRIKLIPEFGYPSFVESFVATGKSHDTGGTMLGSYCINQCLRPMKNYKNWTNNIHYLTLKDFGIGGNTL